MKPCTSMLTVILTTLAMLAVAVADTPATAAIPDDAAIDAALAVDAPRLEDPQLVGPERFTSFHARLASLWSEALARPDADTRRRAADAIGEAFAMGHADLAELGPRLIERMGQDPHRLVRLSAARALIRMDHAEAASVMFEQNRQGDVTFVTLTDPALARWSHEPAKALWRQRAESDGTAPAMRRSAIVALRLIDDRQAEPMLLQLSRSSRQAAMVRLAAADALRAMRSAGEAAAQAAADLRGGDPLDRLVGVRLATALAEPDVDLLAGYAADASGPVAVLAIAMIEVTQPQRIMDLGSWRHADPNARYHAARCLYLSDSPHAVAALANLLDDADPRTRRFARWALLQLDQREDRRPQVRTEAMRLLGDAGWRGLEQAALLLGRIDHEPAIERLLSLLTHDRPETRLAATVALRWLARSDTLEPLLAHAQRLSDRVAAPTAAMAEGHHDQMLDLDRELIELMQFFGAVQYAQAETLMRRFIPKNSGFFSGARGAAVWALGKLYDGRLNNELAGTLRGRLSDLSLMDPESADVRSQSAIALGRMKAQSALPTLRRFLEEENSSVEIGGACKWAIEQITGQTLPPLDPITLSPTDWFLRPSN